MRKKLFVIGLAIIMCITIALAVSVRETVAAAEKPIVWKCSVFGADRVYFKTWHWFVNELAKRSGGRFQIKTYWGEVLSPTKKVLPAIKAGLFEAGMACAAYTPGSTPLGGLPFTLACLCPNKSSSEFRWMWDYNQHPLLKAEFAKFDARMFFNFTLGASLFEIYSNKPVKKLEDLKGLRIRDVPPTGIVWEKLGAKIVSGTYAEVYEMASRHMVDAMLVEPLTATGFRLQEVFKYLTKGVALKNSATRIYCSKKAFNALPKDIKKIYEQLIAEAPAKYDEIWGTYNDKAWDIIKKAGVKRISFPTEERNKLVKIFRKEVWPKQKEVLKKHHLPADEMFNFLIGLSRKYGVNVPD